MNGAISLQEGSLEFADLLFFATVAETRSVTRAAERLHRVQSNVTTRIKRLEDRLGVALFVRGRRGMSLTPEGERLLDYAARILDLTRAAEADLTGDSPRGRLRIGSMESTAAVHLPRILSTLHERYPLVEVQLVTGTSGALLKQMDRGMVNVAFVAEEVKDRRLLAEPVFVEELVLVTHPATRRLLDVSALRNAALVAFGEGCAYRRCIDGWLAARGLRPAKVYEVSSYHAMLACVAANIGYAVAPRSVLAVSNAAAAVRAHRLKDPSLRVTTSLVRHREDRSRAVLALRELAVRPFRRTP